MGKTLSTQSVEYGKGATAPSNPTRAGYNFAGWDKTFNNIIANTTITAKWNINSYKITFNGNGNTGGTLPAAITANYNTKPTLPTGVPTKTGYNFIGWKDSAGTIHQSGKATYTIPAKDSTLTAQWSLKNYAITYNLDGGSHSGNPTAYNIEQTVTLKNPTKTGYNGSWKEGNTIAKGSTGAKTFNALYSPINYTITYVLNGGTNHADNPKTYTILQAVTLKNPTRAGYTFNSWTEGNTIAKGSVGKKTFTAKWNINKYKVTFVDGTGKTLKTQEVDHGTGATAPSNPTRTGYDFAGWDKTFNNITANTTITAKWNIKTFTVTFKTKSKTLKTETVEYNKSAHPPTIDQFPSSVDSTEYVITGWTRDKSPNNIKNYSYKATEIPNITENTTVYMSFWWKGVYYYKDAVLQKGLWQLPSKENPATSKWYLLNKETGLKEQEGSNIYLGGFFNSSNDTYAYFYLTLDGNKFRKIPNSRTRYKNRDLSTYALNGKFYSLATGYINEHSSDNDKAWLKNRNKNEGYYDFALEYSQTLEGKNNTDNDGVRYTSQGAYVKTKKLSRWAPEWLIDNNKYVFYTAFDENTKGQTIHDTYRTQVKDLSASTWTTPVKMKIDSEPPLGFIDPFVIKDGNTYYMFLKNEYSRFAPTSSNKLGELYESIWVYKSTDLTNWNLWYKMLPQVTKIDSTGAHTLYYEGQFVIKIGNTFHFYADIMDWKISDNNSLESLTYPSKFIHLTSTDLKNWTNVGTETYDFHGYSFKTLNTYGDNVRHGTMSKLTDTASINIVQNLYNK